MLKVKQRMIIALIEMDQFPPILPFLTVVSGGQADDKRSQRHIHGSPETSNNSGAAFVKPLEASLAANKRRKDRDDDQQSR